jgi:hypothetical protein
MDDDGKYRRCNVAMYTYTRGIYIYIYIYIIIVYTAVRQKWLASMQCDVPCLDLDLDPAWYGVPRGMGSYTYAACLSESEAGESRARFFFCFSF